ncbi:MAG: hypothetical protein HYY01_08660 [Chloroflexi bacterium]|nr:hypothetical protein [Chloroflexota bacterium]
MPNPLSVITPALELLGKNLNILPATGTAVEDLQHPDQDEIDDVLVHKEMDKDVTAFAEEPEPSTTNIYRPTPPLPRAERHLFRFFLDGSLRTYFLATGIEGTRTFPIELAQIGASVVTRDEHGHLSTLSSDLKVLLLVPKGARGVSDSVWTQLSKVQPPGSVLQIVDFDIPDVFGDDKKDPRDKAGGKARFRMHEMEAELIKATDHLRSEDSWLIIDGAVKLGDFISAPHLIGVAKSFSKEPQFYFGARKSEKRDVTTILAALPYAHRTMAFKAYDGKVAFWYVRMWEQKDLDYPLMGVVKVELPRPDRKPVPADLADLLSRALVAERSVTPYGLDRRWHCHIYPIFMAEQATKNRFFSQQVLMGAIKWPKPGAP